MYQLRETIPEVEDYMRLRDVAGLSPRSRVAAERGLPNTLFGVTVFKDDVAVGMGRVIGDGGCNYEIVDIAVDPACQGGGLGRRIMERIMQYLNDDAPHGAYISMIADVPEFYDKFGFKKCFPGSEGMYIRT